MNELNSFSCSETDWVCSTLAIGEEDARVQTDRLLSEDVLEWLTQRGARRPFSLSASEALTGHATAATALCDDLDAEEMVTTRKKATPSRLEDRLARHAKREAAVKQIYEAAASLMETFEPREATRTLTSGTDNSTLVDTNSSTAASASRTEPNDAPLPPSLPTSDAMLNTNPVCKRN